MSAIATTWAWACIAAGKCSTASSSLVLLRLADRADHEGSCWPGHKTTAADCALAPRTVRQALAELKAAGLIFTETRCDGTGRQQTNRYWLVGVAELGAGITAQAQTEGNGGGGESRHPGVAKSARGGGRNRHAQGVAKSATKPQFEPKKGNNHPDPSGAGEKSGGGFLSFRGKEAPDDLVRVLDAAGVTAERRQLLLDEFDGACEAALAAGTPVKIEKAYLRRLAVLDAEGGLVTEHAERIAGDRRDRAAAKLQAERQKAAQLVPQKREILPPPEKLSPSPARQEGQKRLAELRADYLAAA